VAVILLPQAIAYAMVAELPPEVGLYTGIVGAIIGALWGSSNQLHTGPTNTASLLLLTILITVETPGTPEFVTAAGLTAVMVGVFRIIMALAGMGMLVNFISDSVIVGFTAGAGILIGVNQIRHLLRLDFPASPSLIETVTSIVSTISTTHQQTFLLGVGTMAVILLVRRFVPQLPGPLLGMIAASTVVGVLGLDQQGVKVLGEIPRSLPPLAPLPLFDLKLIGELSTGALAIAVIGLVEAMSISRSIATQTRQRLDNNQELIGQGLSNIAAGFFSGYLCSGSFTRSAVNHNAGAQTRLAAVFSSLFALLAMLIFAPLAAFVPRTALAGVLILTAYGMVDQASIKRIWQTTRGDARIMVITLLATLFLPLQFAVLTGILMSLAHYILKSSMPQVHTVLPDSEFRHLIHQPNKSTCPQLGLIEIHGDLYFGASNNIEEVIFQQLREKPEQRFLLIRMHSVNQCDISGINTLETIMNAVRERGGDLFIMGVHPIIMERMKMTGFYEKLGTNNFLNQDEAISYLFTKVLDPALCIYECDVRVFRECQNLPKVKYNIDIPLHTIHASDAVNYNSPDDLWKLLTKGSRPLIIDVREAREFERGHIPGAHLLPLSRFSPESLARLDELQTDDPIICVCQGGRRSQRVAAYLSSQGYENVSVLRGGILAWKGIGLLEAFGKEKSKQELSVVISSKENSKLIMK